MHLIFMLFYVFFCFCFLVSNLALVKPEKTKAVENYLIQMARYGQLSGKVSPDCLKECGVACSLEDGSAVTVLVLSQKVELGA